MRLTAGCAVYRQGQILFTFECPWDLDSDFDEEALLQIRGYAASSTTSFCVYERDDTGKAARGWGTQAWQNRVAWELLPFPPY